jgi:hypothetical protein
MQSPGQLAARLQAAAALIRPALVAPALEVVTIAEHEARAAVGTYAFGWPPLKPDTIAQKATGDSPLLETGEMRDSIASRAEPTAIGAEGEVYSGSPKAVWHELGTDRIPPRPFLGPALRIAALSAPEIIGRFAARIFGEL